MIKNTNSEESIILLSNFFLAHYPKEAARRIELMGAKSAAKILAQQNIDTLSVLWNYITPVMADSILVLIPEDIAIKLINSLNIVQIVAILSRLSKKKRELLISWLDKELLNEVSGILAYPQDSAGRIMDIRVIEFHQDTLIKDALVILKRQKSADLNQIFILDDDKRLCGKVDISQLIIAKNTHSLSSISKSVKIIANNFESKEGLLEKLNKYKLESLPVIDDNGYLMGIIYAADLLEELKVNMITDMQMMVGVSKDEKATSDSYFSVTKRLPWLQVNLITAFLAASVVSSFQDVILIHTALAVLMPVVAGQAGNTGAQSLAVTVRGLALREISSRDWFRMVIKEFKVGIINGISIALTCGLCVYLWSFNKGLTIIIMLSMIISIIFATIAGALVPISLKKLGFDPAQSSSIVLTTFTDICGFMSFLGIAKLMLNFI